MRRGRERSKVAARRETAILVAVRVALEGLEHDVEVAGEGDEVGLGGEDVARAFQKRLECFSATQVDTVLEPPTLLVFRRPEMPRWPAPHARAQILGARARTAAASSAVS